MQGYIWYFSMGNKERGQESCFDIFFRKGLGLIIALLNVLGSAKKDL